MKIELEVDGAMLGANIQDTLSSLSPAKREELVIKVMEKWLSTEDQLADLITRANSSSVYGNDREMNWNRVMPHPKAKLLDILSRTVVSSFEKRVEKWVQEDVTLKAKFEIVTEIFLQRFPEMVQGAMTNWFANQFAGIAAHIAQLYDASGVSRNVLNDTSQRLGLPPRP